MGKISILNIIEDTIVDGPGFRLAIYAAGCLHGCPGCHNPQSWDICNGHWVDIDEIMERIKANPIDNVTFSGGDPFLQVEAFTELACRIKRETDKTIWCYTGYMYEQIAVSKRMAMLLPFIDVLVDGPFRKALRNENLPFRGSSNQRLIHVSPSLMKGIPVEYVYNPF